MNMKWPSRALERFELLTLSLSNIMTNVQSSFPQLKIMTPIKANGRKKVNVLKVFEPSIEWQKRVKIDDVQVFVEAQIPNS